MDASHDARGKGIGPISWTTLGLSDAFLDGVPIRCVRRPIEINRLFMFLGLRNMMKSQHFSFPAEQHFQSAIGGNGKSS
jgi:hypothetical protein